MRGYGQFCVAGLSRCHAIYGMPGVRSGVRTRALAELSFSPPLASALRCASPVSHARYRKLILAWTPPGLPDAHEAWRERGVRLAQTVQVGPCIPVGIYLEEAEVGPTSGLEVWLLKLRQYKAEHGDCRALGLGLVRATWQVGQEPAIMQKEARPRRALRWGDGGAGGEADGPRGCSAC